LTVQSVLAKLALCRTRALGGHRYQCLDCGGETNVYNSCGDRHCPQCSGSKRYDFGERAETILLEGMVYYQVVFTLPSELSRLALSNRQAIADLLFQSAWTSLRSTIRREQDYDPAAIMVLHSWNQRMDAHWHVHALVPGAGPGIRQPGWKTALPPAGSPMTEGHYLVDAENLRGNFRQRAVARLKHLRASGKLTLDGEMSYLQDDAAWRRFIEHLLSVAWVSYIEPPPSQSSHPNHVVRYLTRYLTGGPLSDGRITSADEQSVTFLAREGSKTGGERKQVPITISTQEFVRRWSLHIQPSQLTKTRYFGGWSNPRRQSPSCPSWYAESLQSADRRLWDQRMGAGYYDWSWQELQHLEESAYPSADSPTGDGGPMQLSLPGPEPSEPTHEPFHIRSF
jgi:hypothetical protein